VNSKLLDVGSGRDGQGQIVSTLIVRGRVVLADRDPAVVQRKFAEYASSPHTIPAPGTTGVVGVWIGVEVCDRNVDYVRSLYREIKNREIDETRSRADGFYRYAPGPRNANPAHERSFGAKVEWRVRYYPLVGRVGKYNSADVALSLLTSGYDLGYNSVTDAGPVPGPFPASLKLRKTARIYGD